MQQELLGNTLEKSEAKLRTLLDNTETGHVLYNADLKIVEFNKPAQKFSQLLYSKELEEGNYLLDYFPEKRHEVLLEITKRAINGEEISYELFFKNTPEGDKWMDVKWVNVKNRENKNWGCILTSKDITQSKLEAIEREKMTNDLIQRNKAMEQFTNMISHNLRAPISNIIGLTEMLNTDLSAEESSQLLGFVSLAAKALDNTIKDINSILQVKQHLDEVKQPVYFHELVKEIEFSISNLVTKHHATIACDFSGATFVYNLRSYLYSVFYNLISNSIKYRNPAVDPMISISSELNSGKLLLTFKDNGKGIDLNRFGSRVFGLYQRFDSSVEGTGIGLFMVKTQVESLGGHIGLKSEPGMGTEFIIEIPYTNPTETGLKVAV
jgi:PAS domain S-box-containing protein